MGPSGRINHVIGYIGYIGYIALFETGLCRFCIWVEVPVQRRLRPIFVRNFGSPDIHQCFRELTGSQRTPGFGTHMHARLLRTKIQGSYPTPSINHKTMYTGRCEKRLGRRINKSQSFFSNIDWCN